MANFAEYSSFFLRHLDSFLHRRKFHNCKLFVWRTESQMMRAHGREVMAATCRSAGMRLMRTTAPLASTVLLLPLATTAFVAGCALHFAGHSFSVFPENEPEAAKLDEATAELLG